MSWGKYLPLLPVDDRLYCEQLKLFLVFENNTMRFYNPETGEILRTLAEETEARIAEERRAEREAQRASVAEEEVARLIAELNALKQQKPQ
jgi:hypothetical protein